MNQARDPAASSLRPQLPVAGRCILDRYNLSQNSGMLICRVARRCDSRAEAARDAREMRCPEGPPGQQETVPFGLM